MRALAVGKELTFKFRLVLLIQAIILGGKLIDRCTFRIPIGTLRKFFQVILGLPVLGVLSKEIICAHGDSRVRKGLESEVDKVQVSQM